MVEASCACDAFPEGYGVRQAFWLAIPRSPSHSTEHFVWLECKGGGVMAIRIRGMEVEDPTPIIPSLAGVRVGAAAEEVAGALSYAWLFPPPEISVEILSNAALSPHVELSGNILDIDAASSEFLRRLHPKIIEAIGVGASVAHYNRVQAWTATVRRNRIQAKGRFPWLVSDLGLSLTYHPLPPLSPDALHAIDMGERKLEAILAKHYQVQPHTIKCLAELMRRREVDEDLLVPILICMDEMKPDLRSETWKRWSEALPLFRWIRRWGLHSDRGFLRETLANRLFRDGISGAQRIFRRELPGHNPTDPSRDLEDYARSLMRWDEPEHFYGEILKDRVEANLGDLFAFFRDSVDWHLAQTSPNMTAAELSVLRWSPLTNDQLIDFGHFSAQELTSATALSVEGIRQKNCVLSYVHRCSCGEAFIFSLVHQEGKQKRTTAHFAVIDDAFVLIEHRGIYNSAPCVEARADVAVLRDALRDRLAELGRSAFRQ